MTLKENYLNEVNLLKNERIGRVIEAAKVEFSLNGIKNSKLRVIAKKAKVGEASIYRYFKDKDDLIKFVALSYWQNHENLFDDYYYGRLIGNDKGIKKIEIALQLFHHLYKNHKEFLKFVEDFDNYYANEVNTNAHNSFQDMMEGLKVRFLSLYNEGLKDGSINPKFDPEEMYSFISQIMTLTTQKLSSRIGYSNEEDQDFPIKCLDNLIAMFVNYIRN